MFMTMVMLATVCFVVAFITCAWCIVDLLIFDMKNEKITDKAVALCAISFILACVFMIIACYI